MQEAELHGVAVIKDNPHLISVRAVQERNFETAWEDFSPKNARRSRLEKTANRSPTK